MEQNKECSNAEHHSSLSLLMFVGILVFNEVQPTVLIVALGCQCARATLDCVTVVNSFMLCFKLLQVYETAPGR